MDATAYDEMIDLLQKELEAELKLASVHADVDLALVGQYQTSGVDNRYSDAQDQLFRERRSGTTVGLRLSMPLEGDSRRSERALVRAKQQGLLAQKHAMMNEVRTNHETMIKSIALLNAGLRRQEANSEGLEASYRSMERKYRQGRVSINQLIMEQDATFQSKLQEIQIKKQIAHALLDYFSVFQDFPCDWNKI
jgi:outer membrane protein TolC